MKKKILLIHTIVMLAMFILVGSVSAQDGSDGYPVDDGNPVETVVATVEPTSAPTSEPAVEPTQKPTQKPTKLPTQEPPQVSAQKPTEAPSESNPICDGTRVHPVLTGLANRFAVDYEVIVEYLCNYEMDIGEIALMFVTVQRSGGDLTMADLLELRFEGELGWDEIWQLLNLIGINHNDDNVGNGLMVNLNRNSNQN